MHLVPIQLDLMTSDDADKRVCLKDFLSCSLAIYEGAVSFVVMRELFHEFRVLVLHWVRPEEIAKGASGGDLLKSIDSRI